MLHEYSASARWEDAVQLCRFANVSPSSAPCERDSKAKISLPSFSTHISFVPHILRESEQEPNAKVADGFMSTRQQVLISLHLAWWHHLPDLPQIPPCRPYS